MNSSIPNDISNVEERVNYIVKEVTHRVKNSLHKTDLNLSTDLSLASGIAGIAVLFGELDTKYPQEQWDLIGHECLLYIQKHINQYGISFKNGIASFSLWGGLAGTGIAIASLSRGGERYKNIRKYINQYLVENLGPYIEEATYNLDKNVSYFDYDSLYGLAGVGRYLLDNRDHVGIDHLLQKTINYLINLSKDKTVLGVSMPSWFIPEENLIKLENYTKVGELNVALSHGIAGPLAFLSICMREGIEIDGQKEAIMRIAEWLLKWKTEDAYGYTWSGRVTFDEFVNNKLNSIAPNNESWCYGSPGIARALWLAGTVLNNNEMRQIALETYYGVLNRPQELWSLKSGIICHGYAGLLVMTKAMYRDTRDQKLEILNGIITDHIINLYNEGHPYCFHDFVLKNSEINHSPHLLCGATGVVLALLQSSDLNHSILERALLIN